MKTIHITDNTGTGAQPRIVRKDAMGAEPWVPKAALDKVQAENARLRADAAAAQAQIEALRGAVTEYHLALDLRQNGNTAGYRLQDEVQRILDMPWRQGAALAALPAKEGK